MCITTGCAELAKASEGIDETQLLAIWTHESFLVQLAGEDVSDLCERRMGISTITFASLVLADASEPVEANLVLAGKIRTAEEWLRIEF